MSGKYMAYVGSYSYTGKAKGITVFDVDVENGTFRERCEMEVDNSSYVIASSDGKTLYSIADEGVVSFRILQNGSLAFPFYLSVDEAGYNLVLNQFVGIIVNIIPHDELIKREYAQNGLLFNVPFALVLDAVSDDGVD